MSDDASRIRTLLALYRESHYDVALADCRVATIRVGERVTDAIADWIGTGGVAYFLTACNPRSATLTAGENDARLATLRDDLDARGAAYLEGAGYMPGETWREASLLVRGIGDDDVAAIVRRYEQNAIVVARSEGVAALRVYRDDWRAVVGDVADVEWT